MKAVLTEADYDEACDHGGQILCSICYEPIETTPEYKRLGVNARPVNDGCCCDFCNSNVVLPARIAKHANG